jgi:hypothetical protein
VVKEITRIYKETDLAHLVDIVVMLVTPLGQHLIDDPNARKNRMSHTMQVSNSAN